MLNSYESNKLQNNVLLKILAIGFRPTLLTHLVNYCVLQYNMSSPCLSFKATSVPTLDSSAAHLTTNHKLRVRCCRHNLGKLLFPAPFLFTGSVCKLGNKQKAVAEVDIKICTD